jgi:hypothetical protein
LLLVADVKQNQLYYAWLDSRRSRAEGTNVTVPVIALTEAEKKKLAAHLEAVEGVAAVG